MEEGENGGWGRTALVAAAGVGLGLLGRELWQRLREADLRGQVALITGGSRGLGFLLAREFAREGCRIAICARGAQGLEQARRELVRGGAEVLAVPCDISDQGQVARLVEETTRHYGRVDVLVNNAGVIRVGPVQAMSVADFE